MIHTLVIDRASAVRRGKRLEYATVAYNSVEGLISIGAGLVAGSIAPVGFGLFCFGGCAQTSIRHAASMWRL